MTNSTLNNTCSPWINFTSTKLVSQFWEYSRNIRCNIPYSKIFNILDFCYFWNIPGIFVFQKILYFSCSWFFLNIPNPYSKNMENRIFEYCWNIPYSINFDIFHVQGFSWNIPYIFIFHRIFHWIFRGIRYGLYSNIKLEYVLTVA